MNIYKRPHTVKGKVRGYIYWIKWKDKQGIWRQQSIQKFFHLSAPVSDYNTASTLVANYLLQEIKGQLGAPVDLPCPGFEEFYREYFKHCNRIKTANTIRADMYRFKRWLRFLEKRKIVKISAISRPVLTEFISMELQGLKNPTINTYITIIRASLSWAVDRGYLYKNPLKGFRLLKVTPFVRPARWSRGDLRKLLSINDSLFLAYLKVIYYTLMRRSEALHLNLY